MRSAEENARQFVPGPNHAHSEAENLLGDFRALLQQIGSPGVELAQSGPFSSGPLEAPSSLGQFLENYLTVLLIPCELPAIVAACGHAQRGELRELIAQDQSLATRMVAPFASPSQRMGSLQLARLRPLRDNRIVQRYLAAVESGRAHGWHTLVYGVTLAVFSLPLRQGLLHYAQATLSVLASAAGQSRSMGQLDMDEMLSGLLAPVPAAVESALTGEIMVARINR